MSRSALSCMLYAYTFPLFLIDFLPSFGIVSIATCESFMITDSQYMHLQVHIRLLDSYSTLHSSCAFFASDGWAQTISFAASLPNLLTHASSFVSMDLQLHVKCARCSYSKKRQHFWAHNEILRLESLCLEKLSANRVCHSIPRAVFASVLMRSSFISLTRPHVPLLHSSHDRTSILFFWSASKHANR